MRLDSFFFGALCVMSGGRLPAALFMVFLLDSKGAKVANECDASQKRFSWIPDWIQKVQGTKSDRSRQEISNEYLVAKIGFDSAENEPLKVCHKISRS